MAGRAHGVSRARSGLAVLLTISVLAAAGCGNEPKKKSDPEASPSPTSAGPSPTSTVPVADPDHAVDPPGPLKGALVRADILIYAPESLSDDVVRRINRLKHVRYAEQLSLASVAIENQVFTVGAVDPATYRRFTSAGQQDEIWARVAGGELALPPKLKKVEQDDAFVQLGSDKSAPKVHVGAYAGQAYGVDMVVNEKWGDELEKVGMVRGNALLVNTGIAAPLSLRKPIQKIIGSKASVQMLDAVARFGLDPDTAQIAVPTGGSVATAVGVFSYRLVGNRVVPDPAWVAANIRTEEVPILGRMTCNKIMFPQLRAALREVVERGLADKIYQTAGCYYPRFIANTTSLSNHAFGLAIDLNTRENQRGTVGQLDRTVVSIFEKWGFTWGGHWRYTDPMHFEMNSLVSVR
jgi:hypothetical protein